MCVYGEWFCFWCRLRWHCQTLITLNIKHQQQNYRTNCLQLQYEIQKQNKNDTVSCWPHTKFRTIHPFVQWYKIKIKYTHVVLKCVENACSHIYVGGGCCWTCAVYFLPFAFNYGRFNQMIIKSKKKTCLGNMNIMNECLNSCWIARASKLPSKIVLHTGMLAIMQKIICQQCS